MPTQIRKPDLLVALLCLVFSSECVEARGIVACTELLVKKTPVDLVQEKCAGLKPP